MSGFTKKNGMPLRVAFICTEYPLPATHGAKVDTLNRLLAFHRFGLEIWLISWLRSGRVGEARIDVPSCVARQTVFSLGGSIRRDFARYAGVFRRPLSVSSRNPSRTDRAVILNGVEEFRPDFIWLDGIWGGGVADEISARTGAPCFLRSHNVEHRYMELQARHAQGVRAKVAGWLSVMGLRAYERNRIFGAHTVYDISVDDMDYWASQGVRGIKWLPPILSNQFVCETEAIGKPIYDLAYIGNLNTPNNVDGLIWFVEHVLPSVQRMHSGITVLIAGSNPSKELERVLQGVSCVTLTPNPSSAVKIILSGRVLINPVLFGSGVNIKSMEMLASGSPVVTTPQGVSGLPVDVRSLFVVAKNADEFARAIVERLGRVLPDHDRKRQRELAISTFGIEAIRRTLTDINEVLDA